ncbi:uncharacterized protein [Montipora capricornis]|uniref:uncharacterized protein n=1 Tax=Montipora capricornis TaxID=246305 RepID=UPI0035F1DB1C
MDSLLRCYILYPFLYFGASYASYEEGSCRALTFQPSLSFPNGRLENHIIKSYEVHNMHECEWVCYQEHDCVSVNFNTEANTDGKHRCELNNSTHAEDNKDLINAENYIYRGTENACVKSPCENGGKCQSGFTQKKYRCLCPPGFNGDLCQEAMMNSVILSSDGFYLRHLAMFLSPVIGDDSRWELCYRSSTHGTSDYTFHSNCDGKSNTVTIVKKNDFVFGGFTDLPWESNGKFGATEKAFIFSLRNAEGLPPFKSNVKDPSKAIHNVGHVGPTFGKDDLLIDRFSANSSSNFGDNYIVPTGVQNRLTLLAGASTFEEDEVEVFFLL